MKKTSLASLQERLAGWTTWEMAGYHLGACLGFWPEFGAPVAYGFDPWHGLKDVIGAHPLADVLFDLIQGLVDLEVLERKENPDNYTDVSYRWNPNYKGPADMITML